VGRCCDRCDKPGKVWGTGNDRAELATTGEPWGESGTFGDQRPRQVHRKLSTAASLNPPCCFILHAPSPGSSCCAAPVFGHPRPLSGLRMGVSTSCTTRRRSLSRLPTGSARRSVRSPREMFGVLEIFGGGPAIRELLFLSCSRRVRQRARLGPLASRRIERWGSVLRRGDCLVAPAAAEPHRPSSLRWCHRRSGRTTCLALPWDGAPRTREPTPPRGRCARR
jgi:hypothetical protein